MSFACFTPAVHDCIANDAVLPAQIASRYAKLPLGAERLWFAVVVDALSVTLGGYVRDHEGNVERIRRQAREWVFGSNGKFPTFEFACTACGLDPDWTRDVVKRAAAMKRLPLKGRGGWIEQRRGMNA
jgi:hypothetical protein